jgi:endonuclease/exonuclease/phosphatase family metal-dependent hydrolase
MARVRFATYNTLDLFASDSPDEREHYGRVVEVVRGLGADVVAVQEISAPDVEVAATRLRTLADDAGMECAYEQDRPAIAAGRQRFHVGLIWRAGLSVVPGSFRTYGAADFWHALATITFEIDGRAVRHASHHATPFGRRMRADQMERVVAVMNRPEGRPPGLVGADWNCVGADRRPDGSYYDPDPYADSDWYPNLVHQTVWGYDEQGRRWHRADREPGEVLYAGGLADAAVLLDRPWEATVGHWSGGTFRDRRIDGIRVTAEVAPALRAVEVTRTELARSASDHLPVTVTYETTAFGASRGAANPRKCPATPR